MPTVSFVADPAVEDGRRVVDKDIAHEVSRMLESVVTDGTGTRAKVPGYRIAGKTGTSHRSQSGGYAEHDPKAGQHFGSVVAAPVFANIMSHALRLQGVEPDDIDDQRAQLFLQGDRS